MSKSITIPTNCNPYIVVINNHVYAYRAGDSVEVPDEVAEVIEDALELEPKPKRHLGRFSQFVEGIITEINSEELDGIATVSPCAFYNYDSLKSIVIPNSVTSIGYSSFGNCNGLASVTIGNGVTDIGSNAFEYCTALKRVILRPRTPPSIQANTFLNVPTTCVFEVPAESVEAYKASPYWSALADKIKAIEE